MTEVVVTEVPSALKQLARLVSRGFYSIEDSLIVDILVRNPCMKEEDICELLKLEKKQLRGRIATLKTDKFIQVRMKVETGVDGKTQRVNYYYVNYKSFVNVVKYKLDHIRRKLDTRERDETNRASFQCNECEKTFTDLEIDQLFNFETQELRCTFCNGEVTESSRGSGGGGRFSLQNFNEQTEQLFDLLKKVEGIRLSAELLAPEPTDVSALTGQDRAKNQQEGIWSGEATRGHGLAVDDTSVKISFDEGDNDPTKSSKTRVQKERPIWMTTSTIVDNDSAQAPAPTAAPLPSASAIKFTPPPPKMSKDDIMSFLLVHEGQPTPPPSIPTPIAIAIPQAPSMPMMLSSNGILQGHESEPEPMDDDTSDEEENGHGKAGGPFVSVAGVKVALAAVDASVVARMSQAEKDDYIRVYQDHFSHMYD